MDLVAIISNLGFPIALSVYLLTRLEKKMDDIENSVKGKDGVIDKLDGVTEAISGKDGVTDKLDELTEAIEKNSKITKANHIGRVKGEKYV